MLSLVRFVGIYFYMFTIKSENKVEKDKNN